MGKFPLRGPFFYQEEATGGHLLQIDHKHGSISKDFNKDTDK